MENVAVTFPAGTVLSVKSSANATLLMGISGDFGISVDSNGDYAIQVGDAGLIVDDSKSIGFMDGGISVQLQYLNLDSVYDMPGIAECIGGSGGYLKYFGVDIIGDSKENSFIGGQLGIGVGAGIDIDIHY